MRKLFFFIVVFVLVLAVTVITVHPNFDLPASTLQSLEYLAFVFAALRLFSRYLSAVLTCRFFACACLIARAGPSFVVPKLSPLITEQRC